MPVINDEEAAIKAIETLDPLSEEQKIAHAKISSIIHDETRNPFVDIHELFRLYNILYFCSSLLPRVEVSWSARLTLCAGICELIKDEQGQYRRIRLKLSEPLLKYRPRDDTINTLLHEAIHAYFFITTSWRHSRGDDGTGHGAGFLLLADAINNHGNYQVTVHHTFHDEVDSYRTHVWQCDGRCRTQAPFFGLVKRSMNRPPSKSDSWWKRHQEECGGSWTKIAEPELTKDQVRALSAKDRAGRQKNKIDGWIKADDGKPKTSTTAVVPDAVEASELQKGQVRKRPLVAEDGVLLEPKTKHTMLACPICDAPVNERDINDHLDTTHPP